MPGAEPAPPASAPPTDPALKRATDAAAVAKAQAEARKLGADADTAEAAARSAALKAVIGEVPPSGFTGATNLGEGAALAEQNALAREALLRLTRRLAKTIRNAMVGQRILLTTAAAPPNRSAARSFGLKSGLVRRALEDAIALSERLEEAATDKPKGFASIIAPLSAVGLVLSGANAALSYLKSDVTLAGRTLDVGDRPLLARLGGLLAANDVRVRIEGAVPPVSAGAVDKLADEVAALSDLATDARGRAAAHAREVKLLTPKAGNVTAPTSPPGGKPAVEPVDKVVTGSPMDPDPAGKRSLHERAVQALDAAAALFDDFFGALVAETDGASLMQRVAEARELDAFLEEGSILLVKVDGTFATHVTEKGLFKGLFGAGPMKAGALVLVSWQLLSGRSRLVAAGCEQELIPLEDVYAEGRNAALIFKERPPGSLVSMRWSD